MKNILLEIPLECYLAAHELKKLKNTVSECLSDMEFNVSPEDIKIHRELE
jgi:hypothetical protein